MNAPWLRNCATVIERSTPSRRSSASPSRRRARASGCPTRPDSPAPSAAGAGGTSVATSTNDTANVAASTSITAGAPAAASSTPPAGPAKYVVRLAVWKTALARATSAVFSPSSSGTIARCAPKCAPAGIPMTNASATSIANDSAPAIAAAGSPRSPAPTAHPGQQRSARAEAGGEASAREREQRERRRLGRQHDAHPLRRAGRLQHEPRQRDDGHQRPERRDHLGGGQRDQRTAPHRRHCRVRLSWAIMPHTVTSAATLMLVDAAARAALCPLGMTRLDSSTWIDDHGWWVVAADFETLGARGTRLVIYADFLWHLRERPARTVAARVRERGRLLNQDGPELACGYESDAQFAALAGRLADRAAVEVHAWREAFPTLRSWAAYLDASAEEGGLWREYDAAVTAGLAGEDGRARHWFDRVFDHPVRPEMSPDPDQDDVVQAQRYAGALTATLDEPAAFRAAVAERVAAARARFELAPFELA